MIVIILEVPSEQNVAMETVKMGGRGSRDVENLLQWNAVFLQFLRMSSHIVS